MKKNLFAWFQNCVYVTFICSLVFTGYRYSVLNTQQQTLVQTIANLKNNQVETISNPISKQEGVSLVPAEILKKLGVISVQGVCLKEIELILDEVHLHGVCESFHGLKKLQLQLASVFKQVRLKHIQEEHDFINFQIAVS